MSDIFVYGQRRPLPEDAAFESFLDPARAAVVSIDMHEGHLSEDADCPCPAPRAREIVAPIDRFHDACRARGLLLGWTLHQDRVIRLAPPLILSDADRSEALASIHAALSR